MENSNQQVFEAQTLEEYLKKEGIQLQTAGIKPNGLKYFISTKDLMINGELIPSGSSIISLFETDFRYINPETFSKWIDIAKNQPKPQVKGKLIKSNSSDFDKYVEDNKISLLRAVRKPKYTDAFELRESLTVVSEEGSSFKAKGGDFILRDPESGSIWRRDSKYFNTNYDQIPREEKE